MIEEEIKITGNTSEAQKSFEDLGKIIAEQKQITIEFEKELIDLEQQLVATGNADWNPKGDALKKKIVGIKEAIKDQRIALKDLNGQRAKAKKSQDDYTKGLSKTSGVVKVLNKLTGGLAGELLVLGKAAMKGGKAMRVALISSGIGVAVALVGFLVEHWDTIGETLGFINKDLEKQFDLNEANKGVIDSELSLLEKQIDFNKKRGISNAENLKELKKLLKAKKLIVEADIGILKTQILRAKMAARELGWYGKIKVAALENLGFYEKAAEIRAKAMANNDIDLEDQQEINALTEQLNNLKIESLDIDSKLDPQDTDEVKAKKKLIEDLDKLQQQAFEENLSKQEKEIQGVKNKYDKIIREAKLAGIETGLVEEGRLQAIEVINAKYRAIDLKEFEKNEKIKRDILDRVGVEGLEAKIKAIEDQAEEDVQELIRLGAHRDQIEAIYQASEDRIAEIVKDASDKVVKEGKTKAAKEVKTAEEVADAKDEVLWNSIDNVDKSFKALAALDEENKALQAASLIASNLISAAKTIQSTIAANAQAKLLFPPTGQPFVTINTVAATLGIAASAAATQKGLAALGKGGSTGGATGLDGAAGGPAAPEFNLVEGSESNAIQESIQSGSDPIKAVVISGEITTAQQVDRNIVEGSGI
jgi:hypothetical protein